MTIGELFGTLQESVTKEWQEHLKTHKYSAHKALNEYYEEMPELVDALIEAWQADNDIIEDYKNLINPEEHDALSYLKELKRMVKEGRKEHFDGITELESLCDDVLALIDSTIYKLDKLTESLGDFLRKRLLAERVSPNVNLVSATLQKRFDDEGIGEIQIKQRDDNTFYLDSNDRKWKILLKKADFNYINKVKRFNDWDDEEWVDAVNNVISTLN